MESPQAPTGEPDVQELEAAWSIHLADPENAMEWLRVLEQRGSITSLIYIGYLLEEGLGVERNLPEAEACCRRACEAGAPDGPYALGAFYWRQGNYEAAERAFSIGAERRDPPSICWLARVYLERDPDARRRRRAAELLESAASLGYLEAQRQLGMLLLRGQLGWSGVPRGLCVLVRTAIAAVKIADHDPHDARRRDMPL